MSYSISGTTISVSGTVDLMNVSLPSIFRINFAAGGANATFHAYDFFYVPPQGVYFTVAGSASRDVLILGLADSGPIQQYEPSPQMDFFKFVNWGANDVIILQGNSDNNDLWGSYENEIFRGGNGNDSYHIGPGDTVDETGTDGVDTIHSYESVNLLGSNIRGDVENVVLTAVDIATYAAGNALANKLVGGMGNSTLNGLGGDDFMQGRAGNDTYYVDTLNDTVDESANNQGGIDTIWSYVSYSLLDTVHVKGAVENLTLMGAALDAEGSNLNNALTGNGFGNTLRGLAGNDVLNGGAGADDLQGDSGNDTYVLGSEGYGVDTVVDSSGAADTITSSINRSLSFPDYSEIENLTLVGNAVSGSGSGLANLMTGNARANIFYGLAGNDRLAGGAGNDTLYGGLNNDFFVFNTAPNAATNRDFVKDFSHVDDAFQLENAIFTKLGAGATHMLSPAFFRAGTKALDANDYIVYNRATGMLSYDNDGNGAHAAIAFAVVTNKPLLTANDFQVI